MSFTAGPTGFGMWWFDPSKGQIDAANNRLVVTFNPYPQGTAAMRVAANPGLPGPNPNAVLVCNVHGEISYSAKGDGSDWLRVVDSGGGGQAVDVAIGSGGICYLVGTGPA